MYVQHLKVTIEMELSKQKRVKEYTTLKQKQLARYYLMFIIYVVENT